MKNFISIIICVFVLFYFFAESVTARVFLRPDLYTAEILVPSNDLSVRQSALSEALLQVLVKVSGKNNIEASPLIKAKLIDAQTFLQSFSYNKRSVNNDKDLLILKAKFDSKSVKNLLREANEPIWDEHRSPVLVAIVDISESSNFFLRKSSGLYQWIEVNLKNHAQRLGIPLILLDSDEKNAVHFKVANTCSFDFEKIRALARHYAVTTVLSGCISRNGGISWQAEFSLMAGDSIERWTIVETNLEALIAKTMDRVFDLVTFSLMRADNFQKEQSLILDISNVNGLEDYSKVVKYIRGLKSVIKVDLVGIKADKIVLKVINKGGDKAFHDAINAFSLKFYEEAQNDGELSIGQSINFTFNKQEQARRVNDQGGFIIIENDLSNISTLGENESITTLYCRWISL